MGNKHAKAEEDRRRSDATYNHPKNDKMSRYSLSNDSVNPNQNNCRRSCPLKVVSGDVLNKYKAQMEEKESRHSKRLEKIKEFDPTVALCLILAFEGRHSSLYR